MDYNSHTYRGLKLLNRPCLVDEDQSSVVRCLSNDATKHNNRPYLNVFIAVKIWLFHSACWMLHQLIGNKHNDDLIFIFYLLSWNTCTIWMAHSYGNRIFKAIQQWQPGSARQVKVWHLLFTEDRVYGFFISGVWEWRK